MKKLTALTLALVLTLAACAAPAEEISSATPDASTEPAPAVETTQLPEPTLPFGFGELLEKYAPYSGSRFEIDCYGDTSLLDAKYRLFGENAETGSIMFSFTAHEPLALTTAQYDGGALVDEPVDCELGYIERVEDGEWAHYCNLGAPYFEPQRTLPYRVVEGEFSESFAFCTYDEYGRTVSYEPGNYRITLYFRKSLDASAGNFTTGEGLYSIQLLFFIPEASETQFDLVNVGFVDNFEENQTFGVLPFIRRNEAGATIYLDHARTRLEVRKSGEWVEATPREGQASAVENLAAEDSPARYADETSDFKTTVYIDKRSSSYRIIYEYCENADGSGERGTLIIPIDTSANAQPSVMTAWRAQAQGYSGSNPQLAHEEIYDAGLGDHPSFGGNFITDDYHLGVNIKGGDPELKAAVLEAVSDPSVIQFVETNASHADLDAQQEALSLLWWNADAETRAKLDELGIYITRSGIRVTSSAVFVGLFARSKAAFDEFVELYGDRIGENIYFEIEYGIELAEVAVHPDDAPPPPPTEPVDTGISLGISNVTRTSASMAFVKDDGGSMRAYTTGAPEQFTIEVWDGEEWQDIPIPGGYWTMMGYPLGEFEIEWGRSYGVLPPGYYRICKSAHLSGTNRYYYAQFTITESTPEAPAGEEVQR